MLVHLRLVRAPPLVAPMVSFVAATMGTDHEASPEHHGEDEHDAGDDHDQRCEAKESARTTMFSPPPPCRGRLSICLMWFGHISSMRQGFGSGGFSSHQLAVRSRRVTSEGRQPLSFRWRADGAAWRWRIRIVADAALVFGWLPDEVLPSTSATGTPLLESAPAAAP